MSDGHDYPDSQHPDWQGGPMRIEPWMAPDEPPLTGSQPSTPNFSPDRTGSRRSEAEEGHENWALIQPPLWDASPQRVEACQLAIAMVLLDEGAGIRDAVRYAKRVVERLKETLE